MSRTFLRQSSQIRNSDSYDDALTMSGAENSAANIEDDLNYIRSQLLALGGRTNWFDVPEDSFDLADVHDKALTLWYQTTADVSVPASQNYVVLTGSAKPSHDIAIADSALGAIVAQLAGSVGSNSLTAATNDGNLVQIRNASNNRPIYDSSSRQIFGLLQVGSAATDGNSFADSGDDRGQISFVYVNPSTDALAAVIVADIENQTIEYAYRRRSDFYGLPENAYDPNVGFYAKVSPTASENKKATRALASGISANTAINLSTFDNPHSIGFGSSGSDWVDNFAVYVNGVLVLNGADAAANNDAYYVSSTELAFEFALESGDILQAVQIRT